MPPQLYLGRVWSNKMQKTVTVIVDHYVKYPKHVGLVRRSSKFKAHDEYDICDIGDWVEIRQARPRSKTKFFELTRVVRKAPGTVPRGNEPDSLPREGIPLNRPAEYEPFLVAQEEETIIEEINA